MKLDLNSEERYAIGECIQMKILDIDDPDEKELLRNIYDRLNLISILEE